MDEKWAAEAGAVSLPAKKRSKAGWIILGLAAALLVGIPVRRRLVRAKLL